jgi:hypothetical protein
VATPKRKKKARQLHECTTGRAEFGEIHHGLITGRIGAGGNSGDDPVAAA